MRFDMYGELQVSSAAEDLGVRRAGRPNAIARAGAMKRTGIEETMGPPFERRAAALRGRLVTPAKKSYSVFAPASRSRRARALTRCWPARFRRAACARRRTKR